VQCEFLGGRDFSHAVSFPRLFSISQEPNITPRKAFDDGCEIIRFMRALVGVKMVMWTELRRVCGDVTFSDTPHKLYWLLTDSGHFSTKSFYLAPIPCSEGLARGQWAV
jgi:hypothetical protein